MKKINLEHLKVFGCACFVHKNILDKLHFTSNQNYLFRVFLSKKGYKYYYSKNIKKYISRDVFFFLENKSFYKTIEEKYCDQYSSNDFMLPCDTNLGGREIFIKKYIHIGNQKSGDNIPP
jgi:hypothetical protein